MRLKGFTLLLNSSKQALPVVVKSTTGHIRALNTLYLPTALAALSVNSYILPCIFYCVQLCNTQPLMVYNVCKKVALFFA
jgi:hypothetical protein